jgi:hypothetical protein
MKILKFEAFLNEAKNSSIIDNKDWDRMSDLILKGDIEGIQLAKSITNKTKAINRFVAGLKLEDEKIKTRESWRNNNLEFYNSFDAIGNKALDLGATIEEIQELFDLTSVPVKYQDKLKTLKDKKFDNRFVKEISKTILNLGYEFDYLKTNQLFTYEGQHAGDKNGRKWTIGYNIEINLGIKKINFKFDAITDEGDGPTLFCCEEFSSWKRYGIREFCEKLKNWIENKK